MRQKLLKQLNGLQSRDWMICNSWTLSEMKSTFLFTLSLLNDTCLIFHSTRWFSTSIFASSLFKCCCFFCCCCFFDGESYCYTWLVNQLQSTMGITAHTHIQIKWLNDISNLNTLFWYCDSNLRKKLSQSEVTDRENRRILRCWLCWTNSICYMFYGR